MLSSHPMPPYGKRWEKRHIAPGQVTLAQEGLEIQSRSDLTPLPARRRRGTGEFQQWLSRESSAAVAAALAKYRDA